MKRSPNRGSRRNPPRNYYSSDPRERGDFRQSKKLTSSNSQPNVNFNTGTIAVLAGVLILGVGIGSAITSTTDGGQGNIASQQQLDMAVPDPEFCRQWGASAFVIDVEMYTTLNPSTSFVTQPALQPGCVTKLVDGFRVVYISTSITKALAPHCLQNSGSGTAISNCC